MVVQKDEFGNMTHNSQCGSCDADLYGANQANARQSLQDVQRWGLPTPVQTVWHRQAGL